MTTIEDTILCPNCSWLLQELEKIETPPESRREHGWKTWVGGLTPEEYKDVLERARERKRIHHAANKESINKQRRRKRKVNLAENRKKERDRYQKRVAADPEASHLYWQEVYRRRKLRKYEKLGK